MDVTLDDLEPIDTGASVAQETGPARAVTMDDLEAIDAPNNSVYHEPSSRVLDLPQTLDAPETQYTVDKEIDGKKDFFAMQPRTPEEAMAQIYDSVYRRLAGMVTSLPGEAAGVVARQSEIAQDRMKTGKTQVSAEAGLMGAPKLARDLLFGSPKVLEAAQRVKERNDRWLKDAGFKAKPGNEAAQFVSDTTGALGQAGAAVFLRMPKLVLLAQSAFQQSDSFIQAKDKGFTVDDAAAYSDQQFAWNLATESVGTAFLFKSIAEDTVAKAVKKSFLTEATQEGGQNVGQDLISNAWQVTDKETKDILVDAAYSALLGGISGGSIGGVGTAFRLEAENRGINTEIAAKLTKHFEEQLTDMPSLMADFLDREVRPIADADHDAKTFLQVMDTAGNDPKAVDTGAMSESDQVIFDQFLRMFNESAKNPQGVSAVEKAFYDQATMAGLDQESSVMGSKLLGARSEAAARGLGITPMEWYKSWNLDIEVQRTPEEAMKSYQEKLDALNTELPDAPAPERQKAATEEDAAIKAEEIAGFEKRLNDAKGGTRDVSTKKPIIAYLKGLGGIRTDGLIYGELKHLGIDRKSAVGLFNNKDKALRDIDNIPVEEFNRALGVAAKDDGNGYVDRDWLLEALRDEQFGQRMGQERPVVDDSFIQALDKAGLDYRTATAEQVYEALGADADIVTAAADMGVELTPKEVRQIRGLMETDPSMYPQDAIDLFVERQAMTMYQKVDDKQTVLPGAERISDKQLAERKMQAPLKGKKPQQEMDIGMFGDEAKQKTLFQSYQRVQTLQRIYEYDLLDKLETLAGYKGKDDKKEAFLERARDNALTEEDLALKKDVVDAAKRVGGRLFQGNFVGPQFYSAVQRNIEALNQPKGSPDQWAGIIKNLTQKGVKQEEIDWLGVMDWLKEQKGSVTKEQVLDYLRANEVKVEEVIKDSSPWTMDFDEDQGNYVVYDAAGKEVGRYEKSTSAQSVVDSNGGVKFDKYTLPGGSNYRELLMTLPPRAKTLPKAPTLKQNARGLWAWFSGDNQLTGAFAERVDAEAARSQADRPSLTDADNYKSQHYAERNILAHIRFNERTDADGKRTMFIEEVQSDWHQAGRDKGYIDPTKREEMRRLGKEEIRVADRMRELKGQDTPEAASEFKALLKKAGELRDQITELNKSEGVTGVPNAPFKTTWPELAFKRALMWAVENNFDSVAWTTGEQQAARYDLSKQIDRIGYTKKANGKYAISADKGNASLLSEDNVDIGRIEELVGKEIAQKIERGEGKVYDTYNGSVTAELTGLDLKVGGEGMKAFYDKMLPSMVNKLVKKWGGKVGTTKIKAGEFTKADDQLLASLNDTASTQQGDKAINKQVWSLDITPSMRESIAKGLPLFQEGARGAITFGKDRTLIQLFQEANPSTLLHELGHLFLRDMDRTARATRRPMVKKDFETIKKWLGSKDGKFTEAQEEKFARGFEAYLREGKAPKAGLEAVFDRFKAWLTSIYKSVKDLDVEINDDVRQVFDRMLGADYARSEKEVQTRDEVKIAADYAAVAQPPPPTLGQDTGDVFASAKMLAANILTPVSSRLGRIDPKLKAAVRKYTFQTGLNEQRDRERAIPFLNALEKMEDADYRMLDFALKNRDTARADELLKKYGMEKEFQAIRDLLDDIYNAATAAGLDVSYLDDYFPRMVKLERATDYMSTLRGRPDWSLIKEAIEQEDPMNQWTDEEKAAFVNKWLRGHASAATYLTKPSFTKDRVIDYVEPQNNQFYLESGEALLKYISAMRLGIAQREIFGKGANAEESIGSYVLDLVNQGVIGHEQENEVKMLMQALINSKGPSKIVSWTKNAGYIYLMGSPISALTQIGDLAFALAKNGYYRTGVSVVKAIAGRSILKKEDLGIDNIAQEFESNTRASKAVQAVFKAVGLSWMDNLGKQTFIESAHMRLRAEAKKNAAGWREYMKDIFGEEADSVRQDLIDGTLSDNVKMLLYSELSDMQPISLAELPVGYLRGGNLRAFYMLKTYTVKQIDIYRREIFDKLASGDADEAKEGLAMLVRLAMALMLTGMGSDAIKDLLLGRAMTLTETTIDNLWKLTTITKYNIYKARENGVGDTVWNILFSFGAIAAPFKDIGGDIDKISSGKRKFKDAETFQRVPLVGKFYYWWYGGGRTKEEKKKPK